MSTDMVSRIRRSFKVSDSVGFKIRMYSSLAGCFLTLTCVPLHLFWGNMSVYVASYFRVRHDIKVKTLSAWTPALFIFFWDFPILLVHLLARRLDKRWIIFLGVLLNETGLLLGLLGVLYPDVPFEIGFGAVCGLGTCFINFGGILIALDWAGENKCFVTSCLQAGISFGGLIVNQMISWYINPNNETPIKVGEFMPFFNQESVNERVPEYLVVHIVSTSVISLVALSMIRIRPPTQRIYFADNTSHIKDPERIHLDDNTSHIKDPERIHLDDNTSHIKYTERIHLDDNTSHTKDPERIHLDDNTSHTRDPERIHLDDNTSHTRDPERVHLLEKSLDSRSQIPEGRAEVEISALSILKTKAFYALAFCVVVADASFITASTHYKEFGQTRIHDDHFLTLTGTTPPIISIICIMATGAVMDKLGTQIPLLFICTGITISFAFIYTSLSWGNWPFFFFVQMCIGLPTTLYNAPLFAFIKLYGNYQFGIKITLLQCVSVCSTLCTPQILEWLTLSYGWHAVFTFPATFSIVAVALIAACVPSS